MKSHLFHGSSLKTLAKLLPVIVVAWLVWGKAAPMLPHCCGGVRIRDSLTPTGKKAYWVIPQAVKQVPFSPVKNINFKGKKEDYNNLICHQLSVIIKTHLQWLVFCLQIQKQNLQLSHKWLRTFIHNHQTVVKM